MSVNQEWKNFNEAFNSGKSKKELIAIAEKMKDSINKQTALNFLKEKQVKESVQRQALEKNSRYQSALRREIEKMVNHPGFLSSKVF